MFVLKFYPTVNETGESPKSCFPGENEEEKLRELLQQEVLKRNHCENQVKEFHSRCLNLEQQIAVAQDSLSKKENNIQSMDQTMSKLLTTWKAQETEHQVGRHFILTSQRSRTFNY